MALPISETFERCQLRYPTVRLPIEVFEARIEEILSSEFKPTGDSEKSRAFAKIHCEDLFLAMACSQGDRVAWEHFADDYVPLLRHFAVQVCPNPGESEDLAQEITAKLLKDKGRLARYNGRGSLAGWLRVAISHAAIDRFRRRSRFSSLEELQDGRFEVTQQNPEENVSEETLDSRWGPVMTSLTKACLRALSVRDRLVLSLYYLRGVSLKDIGRQFGMHEATASRRLERMRRDIRKQVESELRKRHGLRAGEIDSLWKWISPEAVAESVDGNSQGAIPHDSGGQVQKKTAIGESSGVIEEEELQ
jgi:RNA polymerase sigma-70 factor, ECF subfamily